MPDVETSQMFSLTNTFCSALWKASIMDLSQLHNTTTNQGRWSADHLLGNGKQISHRFDEDDSPQCSCSTTALQQASHVTLVVSICASLRK